MPLVELQNVIKHYEGRNTGVTALQIASFGIHAGEFCAVVGPSGSGKSTLLNLVGLLDRPTSGKVFFDGIDLSLAGPVEAAITRNRHIGFVFQAFNLLPRLTALENVALPLLYQHCPLARRDALAREALARVGLQDRLAHRPGALSGGQRQRVAIARALVTQPRLILADEPTGSLDSRSGGEILALLKQLNREAAATVIMVTHDKDLAAGCQRCIQVLDGMVVTDTAG